MDKFILKGPAPKVQLYSKSVGVRLFYCLRELATTDKIACIDITTNNNLSYKNLFETSVKLAIHLDRHGYTGKIIGIYSENRTTFFIPILAALYLGSPIVLLNHGYFERELVHACELTKPELIFCSNKTTNKLRNKQEFQDIWNIKNIPEFCNEVMDKELKTFHPVEVNPKEHVAGLFFSSGTTGLPKAVALTHANLSFVHRSFFNESYSLSVVSNYILCMPCYHVYGFNLGLVTMLKGNTIKFMDKFDPELFFETLEKYKVPHMPLVPPLMTFLAKHPLVDKYDLSSLKTIITGAANCSRELEMSVMRRLPNITSIYQLYGLTETSFAVVSMPVDSKYKGGTVGKLDPGVEMKILNQDTMKLLGANEIGEIYLRCDAVMKGYYGNSEGTKDVITDDGWLRTGDLGYYNDEGYVFIVDRLKELIKFKAFQVAPAELEGLLISHPKVMDAAVVGYPDDAAGELPLAFIVQKPGVEVKAEEIISFIKGQVSYPKQLHGGVRFVDFIPKSPSGKILRRVLRARLRQRVSTHM